MKQVFLVTILLCVINSVSVWAQQEKKKEVQEEPQTEGQTVRRLYVAVEQMPEYPGGMNQLVAFLSKNIEYPQQAIADNVKGNVYVSFIITKTGAIEDIWVEKGVRKDLDDEAVRVIRLMPSWQPGKQNRKTVDVKYVLPVKFTF